MTPDDDETPQSPLPPNAIAYNGVTTPYSSGTTTGDGLPNLATGNSEITTDEKGNQIVVGEKDPARESAAAFDRSAFAADAFAINGGPLNDSAINGSDDGIYSIDEPLPDISDFPDDEDWNQPGDDEDWNQPNAREDYTKTVLNRTDNPPHGEASLIDENRSFLTDSAGNPLIVGEPGTTATGSTVGDLSFAPGSGSTFGNFTFGQSTFGQSANQPATSENFERELLSRLGNLEAELKSYQRDLPPRSHNHPPEPVEPDPITPSEVRIVVKVTIEMRAEAQQVQPDPIKLEAQASTLRRVADSILAWLGRKADLTVDTAIKSGVPMIMRAACVLAALTAVLEKASAWAHFLSMSH